MIKKTTLLALISFLAVFSAFSSETSTLLNSKEYVSVNEKTNAPTITLLGATPQIIQVGSNYVELNAQANDTEDGDISADIVIDASSVNTTLVGSYTVTYNVTDSNSNAATEVTRTVNVVDTTKPVITLTGANPQILEVEDAYTELNATASDNYDGNITADIVIDASNVVAGTVGSYTVTYNVTDANSNTATEVTRTVNVVDTTKPVITLTGANPQILEVEDAYTELNATASDNYDGNITADIVIDASNVVAGTVGSYTVTYNVTDANSNTATEVTRTVNVVDTTKPVITLTGANPQILEVEDAYTELNATASDNYDGNITADIVIDASNVVAGTVGSYTVTYNVTDANSNTATEVTRTVNVVDTTKPVITLTGANPQILEVEDAYTELNATASDNYDGNITADIVIDASNVVAGTVGSYTVTYNVTDANSNTATEVTRTVNVVDTTKPVITLTGANPQILEVEDAYTELNATASDNYDGNITADIVIDASNVVAGTVGSYTVTYNVTDANSNTATEVTRTVNVVDTTNPTAIAVAGPLEINLNGNTTLLTQTVDNGSSDNYVAGGITLSLDKTSFSCADLGANTVTLTVTDSSNNTDTATVLVNVIDDVAPANVALVNPNYVHRTGTAYAEQGLTYSEVCFDDVVIVSSDLDVNQWGTYTIVYKVVDTSGNESATITRTQVVNDTPTTDAASFTVNQDTENHVFDVLDGDSFGNDGAESFTISGAMSAQNGTLVLQDLGTADPSDDLIVYSPRATYNGPDSFTYTLEDENGDTVTTTVNITVRPIVPVPVDDTATVDKNSSNNIIAVLANDDFGGNEANATHPLTFTNGSKSSATPNGGLISIEDNSTPNNLIDDVIHYTPPADFTGTDTFMYTITDLDGDATTATVEVTVVEGSNGSTTPTAVVDSATVDYESVDNVIPVLGNDSEGSDLYIDNGLTLVNGTYSGASTNGGLISVDDNGTLSTSDDTFKYSAPAGFDGTDTFSYTITDTTGDASTAVVTVTVNPAAPLEGAVEDIVTTPANTPVLIDVLANDNFGTFGSGTLLINSPDHLTGDSAEGVGTLTLDDGGTAGINQADDKILYTPPTNFNGVDTFDYTLTVDSNQYQGTVTITVGTVVPPVEVPTAVDDSATVDFESSNNVIAILGNDTYGSDGLSLTHPLTLVNGKQSTASLEGGLISVSDNGTQNDASDDVVLYSAPAGFSGTDSFEYTITDEDGDAATATVTITVNPAAPLSDPTAVDDAFSVTNGSSNNDLDILDNDSFGSEGLVSVTLSAGSEGGTLVINQNGTANAEDITVTYTPAALFENDVETFTYTLEDGGGDTVTATVSVTVGTVAPAVTVPTAADDAVTVAAGSVNNVIDVLSNDTPGSEGYIDGGLTMTNGTLTSASTKGSAISIDNKNTLDTTDDEFNYTPSALAATDGTDTFSYTITDASGDASTATVTVTIGPAATDVPVALDDAETVVEDTTVSIDVLDNDVYGDDGAALVDALTVGATSDLGGTTSVVAGEIEYTPALNFVGTDTFEYTIEDGNGDTATATVTVTVTAEVIVNGTPTAVDDSATVDFESSNNVIAVLGNDTYGSDGLSLTHPLTLVNGKQSTASLEGGLISVSDNGTQNDASDDIVLYSAPAGFSGTDSFEYTITDEDGDAATATVTITVDPAAPLSDPTAVDDTFSVANGSSNNDLDILDNDSFGSEGLVSVTLSAGSEGGTLVINQNGTANAEDITVTYTPAALFENDVETFTYTLEDGRRRYSNSNSKFNSRYSCTSSYSSNSRR
ncbi:S-layer family protein [Polaribacter sp. MED152]|uniref:beta strand repeat-containing protein n=1 Tax=Polaribacter sp. MED152 TaxID=313598 RepID=UPI000068C6E8|nr:immunoglobulin-like domain-containing protein [Polaribacter sp. MED152]EAQ41065.1 putative cell wall associated biofilm protein [Polaribacter sp. MED152]